MGNYKEYFLVETIYTSSDDGLTAYFAYVSGEHIGLAKAEVEALLNQLSYCRELTWDGRLARIVMPSNPADFLLERAALIQYAGIILYETDSFDNITQGISDDDWTTYITKQDDFAVKTLCIGEDNELDMRLQIERTLGAHIKQVTGANVNLRSPSVQILVLIMSEGIVVCKSDMSKLRALLRGREPGKKEFFHPSMMNSSLARVMCNLAGVQSGDIVLDPFCGGGGILCEASHIGASVIGIDLSWKLLIGARVNLSKIGLKYSLIQGDTQHLPIKSVNRIVSDPPYGRASSTRGTIAIKLVESLLEEADSILQSKGECLCLCSDSEMKLSQIVEDTGLTVARQLSMRVHSGLVRDIVTVKI
ncbi:MAG: methyltransferase domain-containing protein [Candidatus Thorarchaeota archaeon]|nr:MAG: methyltransferase domain-containing protein [Candidatus Thorarchaeota archaeon]